MPRFFFHIRCRQHLIPDRVGADLPVDADLSRCAAEFARDPLRRARSSLMADPDCLIEVVDERRQPLLRLPLANMPEDG